MNTYYFKKQCRSVGSGRAAGFSVEACETEALLKNVTQYPMLCEYTSHPDVLNITPFVDFDMNFHSEELAPKAGELKIIEAVVRQEFESLFLNCIGENKVKVLTASRKPAYNEKGRWHISYRFWCRGLHTTRQELGAAI